MFSKYVGSFLLALVLVCCALSTLKFATRSQVRAGEAVDETWTNEFTLDARQNSQTHYRVDAAVKADLEKGIAFVGSGVVQVRSTAVTITPQTVSWTNNKKNYNAPGARMVARVTWATPADARDGDRGDIRITFPKLRGIPPYTFAFHSGVYRNAGDGRIIFREATTHRSPAAVALARILFVLSAGLPMTIILHSIWWAFQLKNQKKARLAELQPPSLQALPRVFYPSPISEWVGWTFTICIFGFFGSLLGAAGIYQGFLSTAMDRAMLIVQALGLVVGLIVVAIARASIVTVRIDHDGIAYAKGRGEPNWISARWSDLRGAQVKRRSYKGQITTWIELVFPDGKTRNIPASLTDFQTLRHMVLEQYARHH